MVRHRDGIRLVRPKVTDGFLTSVGRTRKVPGALLLGVAGLSLSFLPESDSCIYTAIAIYPLFSPPIPNVQ